MTRVAQSNPNATFRLFVLRVNQSDDRYTLHAILLVLRKLSARTFLRIIPESIPRIFLRIIPENIPENFLHSNAELTLLHRLDIITSGVVVFAKNKKSATEFGKAMMFVGVVEGDVTCI